MRTSCHYGIESNLLHVIVGVKIGCTVVLPIDLGFVVLLMIFGCLVDEHESC